MTSALLFVAVLALVDLSYRRWMRRSISRRSSPTVDREDSEAAIIALPARGNDGFDRLAPVRGPAQRRGARRSS